MIVICGQNFKLFSVKKIVCRQLLLSRVTPLYYILANPLPVLQPLLVLPTCDYCPVVLPQLQLSKLQLLRVLSHGEALPLLQQVGALLNTFLTV